MIGTTLTNHQIPATRRFLDRIRGVPIRYDLRPFQSLLGRINRAGSELVGLGNEALRQRADALRAEIDGELDDGQVAEAYALVRESAHRTIGLRAFDVQIVAALGLHRGNLVEMQTGEGKTLVIVFAAFAAALAGQGVHVLTFNDYLARRDAEWMGPAYALLGVSVGAVQDGMKADERHQAYRADVTYAAAKQVGFDFLRDTVALKPAERVLRSLHAVIVDEADALLVDEARVPMVIAGVEEAPPRDVHRLAGLVKGLDPSTDFDVDGEGRGVTLSDAGMRRCERWLDCGELVSTENLELLTALNCALHAEVLLRGGVDYIVRNGRVELVDELTGRVIQDRHWPYGLQTALEAKEGLELHPEGRILGSITVHHFLSAYEHKAGLTATARPAAEEIEETYELKTLVIPPAKPCIRVDHADRVFRTKQERDRALAKEIEEAHDTGRPILIGTRSVQESEQLAATLAGAGVAVQVLNARNDAEEAAIITAAGAPGAVTVSTNMAGRGTDIRLGGADESHRQQVESVGGLYVIGTNRHDSLRIDNQLRGRAGRQGDPGASRFFVSLEDDLVRRYGVLEMIPKAALAEVTGDGRLTSPVVRQRLAHAQRIVEGQHRQLRTRLRSYGDIVESQRQSVHERRTRVLEGRLDLQGLIPEELTTRARGQGLAQKELTAVVARLTLLSIDRRWSDHLAYVSDQRETIFLEQLGGRDPLMEFHVRVDSAFTDFFDEVEEEVRNTGRELAAAGPLSLDDVRLQGPSSTWTYLMNDNPLGDASGMLGIGNIGLGAGAAFGYWPLLLGWGIMRLLGRKRDEED